MGFGCCLVILCQRLCIHRDVTKTGKMKYEATQSYQQDMVTGSQNPPKRHDLQMVLNVKLHSGVTN